MFHSHNFGCWRFIASVLNYCIQSQGSINVRFLHIETVIAVVEVAIKVAVVLIAEIIILAATVLYTCSGYG